jgi:hypothetical protein
MVQTIETELPPKPRRPPILLIFILVLLAFLGGFCADVDEDARSVGAARKG